MGQLFNDTIVSKYPLNAVTFVENHDSQPNQSLESYVKQWFKTTLPMQLYCLEKMDILCIFYGDYYGTLGDNQIKPMADILDKLMD